MVPSKCKSSYALMGSLNMCTAVALLLNPLKSETKYRWCLGSVASCKCELVLQLSHDTCAAEGAVHSGSEQVSYSLSSHLSISASPSEVFGR
jgi:hypothetical protein